MNKNVEFIGLQVLTESAEQITRQLLDKNPKFGTAYHLVNAYTVVLADESPLLYSILKEDSLICDGKPLARILKLRDSSVTQIRGADFMRRVFSELDSDARHFFLGSTDEVLQQLVFFAKGCNPDIEIVGTFAPDYSNDFSSALPLWVKIISEANPTIVWVGLGTPKQDFVSHEIAKSLPVNAVAVGAAFDYLSGNISEAPKILQSLGVEWLYRLLREPKRLAGRYLVGNLKFIRLAVRELHKQKA